MENPGHSTWIETAESVLIHSGNIVNWNQLKRKVTQTPTEELEECLRETIKDCRRSGDCAERLHYKKNLACIHSQFADKIDQTERDELKLTVKISMCDFCEAEKVADAIKPVLQELDTTFIETVLLAFPVHPDGRELTLDDIKPYWEALEDLVAAETVLTLGVSDLNQPLLKELCDWAKVKPCINQVNLSACCVMPEDLVVYAKQANIQLLTHNDPKDLLPVQVVRDIFREYGTEGQVAKWVPLWALRYTVLVKCRGIIKNKGYVAKITRREQP